MYGLVNQAVEDLIVSTHGEEQWQKIKSKAGVGIEVFMSNEGYPDEITFQLVQAAAQVLDSSGREILIAFGEHWVLKTACRSYGAMMRSGGQSLKEFLINLPNLHTRVQMIYPKLQPPRFEWSNIEDNSMHLHYFTHRPGLTDFVVGIIQGLGKLYETPATATLLMAKAEGADHDVFEVSWAPKAA